MKRIALLNGDGLCLGVAAWDGTAEWNPVTAGLCASTQDVTANPQVGPGWTYSAGAWTAPTAPAAPADVNAFVTAVASDASLAASTRLAAVNSLASLTVAVASGQTSLITAIWQLLIAEYSISSADQAEVHTLAVQFGIPGI